MKKCCIFAVIFTACWLILTGTVLQQEKLASKLIRIHVVANSDKAEDQAIKLQVRDAVLGEVALLTEHCQTRGEAAAALAEHAQTLGEKAAQTAGMTATVALSPEVYETRHYDSVSLPAGEYLSLQIRLGEAEGKNWWCVAFPMVCMTATAEELEAVAVSAGMDGGDIRLMTDDSPDITVRFALLEWIAGLRERLRS